MNKRLSLFEGFIIFVFILMVIWCSVSFIDVMLHQMDSDYIYSSANIFVVLLKIAGYYGGA